MKIKLLLLILSVGLWLAGLNAQTMEWQYYSPGTGTGGVEQAFCLTRIASGGFVFAGRTGPVGLNAGALYVSKISETGTLVWAKTFEGDAIDEARSIRELEDGSLVLCGVTVNYGNSAGGTADLQQMLLMKLNADGDTVFTRRFGGPGSDTGEALEVMDDGGFLIVGRYGIATSDNQFYLVRTKSNGDTMWTKKYGGNSIDIARSVSRTTDGGLIIAGNTRSFGPNAGSGNIWLMKTDADGDTLWTSVIGSTSEEECYSVIQAADQGYVLAGRSGNNASDASDIFVVKTDSQGQHIWEKTHGFAGNDQGRAIIRVEDGGYAIAGSVFTDQGAFGAPLFYLLRIDDTGNKLWDYQTGNFNSPNGAKGYDLVQVGPERFVVSGENDMGSGSADVRALIVQVAGPAASLLETADIIPLLHPNPCKNPEEINLPATGDWINCELRDLQGRLMAAADYASGKWSWKIFSYSLQPGIYAYNLYGKGNAIQGKLLIE